MRGTVPLKDTHSVSQGDKFAYGEGKPCTDKKENQIFLIRYKSYPKNKSNHRPKFVLFFKIFTFILSRLSWLSTTRKKKNHKPH